MSDKEIEKAKPKKPKGKPRGGNNFLTDSALNVEAGDNTKYVLLGARLFNLPSIDLKDPQQVNDRLNEFFQIHAEADMKPTVAGMGMALGLDRRRLWEIKTGNLKGGVTEYDLPTPTLVSIKKAYEYMEILWENYMQNGKINPVSGIFLGKNNFGYQDKTEMVVTPNTNSDTDYSVEDIRKRYLPDSPTMATIDSPDSDTDS
jgi:hypothetical protein